MAFHQKVSYTQCYCGITLWCTATKCHPVFVQMDALTSPILVHETRCCIGEADWIQIWDNMPKKRNKDRRIESGSGMSPSIGDSNVGES